ncbi:Tn3 family transposase, partial [Skermanella aerolata]
PEAFSWDRREIGGAGFSRHFKANDEPCSGMPLIAGTPNLSTLPRLARWLFFANQGAFRTGDYEEIMNKASCLSLLSNAVLVWNTVHIDRIITQLRANGHAVADEDLARVSPLIHAHVIPNGTYFQSQRRRTDALS